MAPQHPQGVPPSVVADDGDEAAKAAAARSVLLAQCMMATGAAMILPVRPSLVLATEGDAGKAARMLGLQSSSAAVLELFLNPLLGRFSDRHGRRPCLVGALLTTAVPHALVAVAPGSRGILFVDRIMSGASIEVFLTLARAALSDICSGPSLAAALAKQGACIGLGQVLGSYVGARLGGARAFACSAAAFVLNACWVIKSIPETHPQEKRRPFSWLASNPLAFLQLFKDKTLGTLALTVGLQSFADFSNIMDVSFLYLRTVLDYGQTQTGNFVTAFGLTRAAGGALTPAVLRRLGQAAHVQLANSATILALGLLSVARSTRQVMAAMLVLMMGHQRSTAVDAHLQKRGAAAGMGHAEVAAASTNFLAVIRVLAPLAYGRIFSWATSEGRGFPGLPFVVAALFTSASQLTFWSVAPDNSPPRP